MTAKKKLPLLQSIYQHNPIKPIRQDGPRFYVVAENSHRANEFIHSLRIDPNNFRIVDFSAQNMRGIDNVTLILLEHWTLREDWPIVAAMINRCKHRNVRIMTRLEFIASLN